MESPLLKSRIRTTLSDARRDAEAIYLAVEDFAYQVFRILLRIFVRVFPRPNLPDEELNRSSTVVADFVALEIIYTLTDYFIDFHKFRWLGHQNYILYTATLMLIRYHAVRGRLKLSVGLYGASIVYFYLLVTADLQYFEHMRASNLIATVAFATITMGPRVGFVALALSLLLLTQLLDASRAGLLSSIEGMLPPDARISSTRSEWKAIVTNLIEMYIFCWLVRSHIFSQLYQSLARERGISAKEEKARKAADRADGEKTRFIASASHDLRQPVSSLVLNFEGHVAAHPEFKNDPAVNDMRSSINSLSNMLDSILTVSKLDANVLVPKVSMVCLNDILERCYSTNAATARQKGLDIRMRETDLFCETDPEMLFRAMNNIVNNAVKYTNTGGLIMGVRRRGGGSALFVMDSGIGIPAESLSTIYDEFTMLVDSSRKAGSGLGLSIVKKMLRLLGMDIQTLSKVGVGSTFYIDLPKTYSIPSARKPRIETTASKEVPEPQKADTAIEEAPIAQDSTGRLVAVVDDVVVLRKTICRVLESFGMRTIDVGNLSELEAVIKDVKPDLLITDYKLEHGVTGYDIIVAARKLIADLPAFIITGDTSPALVSEMSARGVTIYYKPVTINTMIDAVNEHLAS